MRFDVMKTAMQDELEKISGELQGFTRSGRKPISVDRILEREEETVSPSEVLGLTESAPPVKEKLSMKPETAKTLGLIAAGAGGAHVLRKANDDRKLGRAMRVQNGGSY